MGSRSCLLWPTSHLQSRLQVLWGKAAHEDVAHTRCAPLCRPSGSAGSARGAPAMHMADEAASASNLCYFVAIHEVLLPSHSLASNAPSLATTMGPAPATPFTGLELGPLLGKARPLWHGHWPVGSHVWHPVCVERCTGRVLTVCCVSCRAAMDVCTRLCMAGPSLPQRCSDPPRRDAAAVCM